MKKGITLISLIITIIVILILAGAGIAGSFALIEEAKYTAFINEMKQVNEAITILIAEKQLEVADTGNKIQLFSHKLNSDEIKDLPEGVRKEVEYVRDLLAGILENGKLPSDYDGNIEYSAEEGKGIFYVDREYAGDKYQAYIYDEQSASAYKVEPTIIWGVEMHGYEYGNLLVTQPGLLEKAKDKAGVENSPQEPDEPTISDLITTAATKNTYTQDKYGNKIVIPAGFRIVAHDEDYVVYDYDIEEDVSTNEPVVQDGIVIEHATDENQFVWVPVGTIKNDAVENTTNTTTIQLGRYATYTMDTITTIPIPPNPTQVASKTEYETAVIIYGNASSFENQTGTYNGTTYNGNTKAYNLGGWISSTIDNGGYYIARYEASYGIDEENNTKALSQPSTDSPLDDTKSATTAKTVGQLCNWITQPDAADASRLMYPNQELENAEYYSDLINSYAWDTAIIFIQTYSENATYASKVSVYKDTTSPYQPANTGERGADAEIEGSENTTDKVCNIYDMASNLYEWTTETDVHPGYNCTGRGGFFISNYNASFRGYDANITSHHRTGFRPLLYVRGEQ